MSTGRAQTSNDESKSARPDGQSHALAWPTEFVQGAMGSQANNPRLSLVVLLVSLMVFFWGCATLSPFIPDDAYISFRYAENLALGHGLTFNRGEVPVEGFSNLA